MRCICISLLCLPPNGITASLLNIYILLILFVITHTWYVMALIDEPDSVIKSFRYRASSCVSHDLTSGPIIAEFAYLGNASSTLRSLVASLPRDDPSTRDSIEWISTQINPILTRRVPDTVDARDRITRVIFRSIYRSRVETPCRSRVCPNRI